MRDRDRSALEVLVPYRAPQPDPRLRLLCFPHGGGTASVFREWQSLIGEEIEVWPVQLPGREGRRHETPHRSMAEAVEELVAVLGPRLDRPFALFGHSVGADVAYAFALELHRTGLRPPEHLIVAGQVPPHDRVVDDPLHLLGDDELLERLEGYGGIPDELLAHPEALRLALPRLRADLEMSETYRVTPADRLDVPITAFGGLHDRTIHAPDIERWGELTTGRFHVEWWPGGHFFVHANADEVIAQIEAALAPRPGPREGAAVRPPGERAAASPPRPDAARVRPSAAAGGPPRPAAADGASPAARDVAEAMAEVVPALEIEPDDSFFDAGLQSIQLLSLQEALQSRGYELEITDLFRWPTIRRLAAALDERRASA